MLPLRSGPLFACCLTACGAGATVQAPEGAPNVLLISVESLRADRLGFLGYPRPTSAALDAFAAGSVVFESAQAAAPGAPASLASLLCGEEVATHACRSPGAALDPAFETLPERLLAAGYDTTSFVSHPATTASLGLQQGFVSWDDSFAIHEVEPLEFVSSQAVSDKAIRFLGQRLDAGGDSPWFLWLHYFDPHREFVPHPGLQPEPAEDEAATSESARYDSEVAYTLGHIGRVLATLEDLGLESNTVVLWLGDHGEEFQDHGDDALGESLRAELLHVPLVVRAPGFSPRRVREVVRIVDVLPTVLELVGLPLPPSLAGRSLVPLLGGAPWEPLGALAELDLGFAQLESWRTAEFHLIRSRPDGLVRLFALASDPGEVVDLASERPGVVRTLLVDLERALERARARAAAFGVFAGSARTQDPLGLGYSANEPGAEEPTR